MKHQTIVFGSPEQKKHSIRYRALRVQGEEEGTELALTDIYVRKTFLEKDIPAKIDVVIEYTNGSE